MIHRFRPAMSEAFALLLAGKPVQIGPQQVSETQFLFNISTTDAVNHIVVFLTGAVPLPQEYAAAVYFSPPTSNAMTSESWFLLGFICNEKPSAIFKVSKLTAATQARLQSMPFSTQPVYDSSHIQYRANLYCKFTQGVRLHLAGRRNSSHIPVLVDDVIKYLQLKDKSCILDATSGGGGHLSAILKHCDTRALVFCLDRDALAITLARRHLVNERPSGTSPTLIPLLGKFSEMIRLLARNGIGSSTIDAILFDFGASSMQFDVPERGFSLSNDGPLDMRMDGNRVPNQPTAADVVNYLEEDDLCLIIRKYGEEKAARHIARTIVDYRHTVGKIRSTLQLADIVAGAFEHKYTHDKIHRSAHVATRTFQALRIFVNNELNELVKGLKAAHYLLKPGGRCLCISFHSLEDRIVKQEFIDSERWEIITRKPVLPSDREISENPRSRSAKLRVAAKAEVVSSQQKT